MGLIGRVAPDGHALSVARAVEVMMMLMFPLLAIALAVPPKRSSSGLGIFIAILIVVAYHKVNQYAEQSAAARAAQPNVGLWVPLVMLAGADLLDVPCARAPARRPADRRARVVLRGHRQARPRAADQGEERGADA